MGSSTVERVLTARSARELEALAAAVAANLEPGDRVLLEGELGAGKTVFVRGLVRGLGHPDPAEVTSPTFAIHHRYEGGRLTLDHVDLYRLTPPVTLEREGLEPVIADFSTVLCCEWPERLARPLPGVVLRVILAHAGPDVRRVTLRAGVADAVRLFRGLTGGRA